jgi:NAD(P)H-dependent flavin oxidoreductase YrpB (nitropropane dioxygenase family)
MDELGQNDPDALLKNLASVKSYCAENQLSFPVIVGGGIYDGREAARFLEAGADGVQMATRFVCTDECDADIRFKQEYLRAEEKDIAIIKSPVGLPGRVVVNPFVKGVLAGERVPFRCNYKCLKTCDPTQSPYCIAKVLADAAGGNLDKAFAFAGANAWRCTEIVPVKKLVSTLLEEMNQAESVS